MKVKSLRNKFIGIYFGIILCTFLILAYILPGFIRNYFIEQKERILTEESKVISKQYINFLQNEFDLYKRLITAERLTEHFKLLDEALDARLMIIDEVNGVAYSSGVEIDNNIKSTAAYQQVIQGKTITVIGAYDKLFGESTLSVGHPIIYVNSNHKATVIGAVFFHINMQTIMAPVEYVYNSILTILLLSLAVALLLILILTNKIIIPLKQMNDAAKNIANGDFSTKVNIYSDDEVGELASSFNYMAEELGKLEELRKSFIANISHDFRSPLTSIKGFVQAMLDGTIPVDSQDKYLNIVLDESERLTKLTNNILDLTKMEGGEIKLDIVEFDLHEVIRKIIIGFEQRIVEKDLKINLLLIQERLIVLADIEKIQRVIYNLLDNAIKFVNNADEITVETSVVSKKALITISDTGPGIEKDSLKYVFDRFHKADKSRGRDKKGTGLGLAIVKQIIKNHGEDIIVESEVGVGTKFIFELPVASKKMIKKIHNY